MDLQKIRVRQDIGRMVYNYYLMGKITERQAGSIVDFIDGVIGGGEITSPEPTECRVYIFPVEWRGRDTPMFQVPERRDNIPEPPRPDIWDYFKEHGIHLKSNITRALHREGAYDLESTAALSAKRLLIRSNGIGEKGIAELREFLQSRGLDLKD
jgi:hypothetical protein